MSNYSYLGSIYGVPSYSKTSNPNALLNSSAQQKNLDKDTSKSSIDWGKVFQTLGHPGRYGGVGVGLPSTPEGVEASKEALKHVSSVMAQSVANLPADLWDSAWWLVEGATHLPLSSKDFVTSPKVTALMGDYMSSPIKQFVRDFAENRQSDESSIWRFGDEMVRRGWLGNAEDQKAYLDMAQGIDSERYWDRAGDVAIASIPTTLIGGTVAVPKLISSGAKALKLSKQISPTKVAESQFWSSIPPTLAHPDVRNLIKNLTD